MLAFAVHGQQGDTDQMLAQWAASDISVESMKIQIGEQKTVNVVDSNRISIGRRGIVDVRVLDEDEVLVTGVQVGITELLFWDNSQKRRSLRLEVVPPLDYLARDIGRVLSDIQNVRVSVVGQRIVVDGKLLTKDDAERVKTIVEQLGGNNVINLTTIDRGPENVLVEDFIVKTFGQDTVSARIVGGTAYLSGFVYNLPQKERLLALAQTQVEKVVDLVDIREVMIDTEILFVKITRSAGFNIGINLLDGGDGLVPNIELQGSRSKTDGDWSAMDIGITWTLNLIPRLNVIMSRGHGSILSRPHIITKSGEKGSFQSGGTLYYKVAGAMAADLESVDYGLIIEVEPHFRSREEIVSTVSLVMSIPTTKSGSQDLALDKYQMQNTVSCKLGQSIIISGFLESMRNKSNSQTPILGDIPLLNFFFSSKQRDDTDTEIVAIITPRVMNAADPSIESMMNPGAATTNIVNEMKSVDAPLDSPLDAYRPTTPPLYPPL